MESPCDPAAKAFLGARWSVRQWIHILRQQGRLLEKNLVFYVKGYTRLLRSILVLLFYLHVWKWPRTSSNACLHAEWRGVHSTCFGRAFFPRKSGHYFYEPLVLQYFQLCAVSASDFLGALDDGEFFVVEGSCQFRP